jgi:hypothetical protein
VAVAAAAAAVCARGWGSLEVGHVLGGELARDGICRSAIGTLFVVSGGLVYGPSAQQNRTESLVFLKLPSKCLKFK